MFTRSARQQINQQIHIYTKCETADQSTDTYLHDRLSVHIINHQCKPKRISHEKQRQQNITEL